MSNLDFGEDNKFLIKKLTKTAKIPTRNFSTDAGLDLYCDELYALHPNKGHLFKTGVAFYIPDGYVGKIEDRSGLGAQGISKHGGILDSNYRGEILVYLFNHSNQVKIFNIGDRIAQLLIHKVKLWVPIEVDELPLSIRGDRGFGSSGK